MTDGQVRELLGRFVDEHEAMGRRYEEAFARFHASKGLDPGSADRMVVMDGLQATASIREQEQKTGAHVAIVAMTAHAMQEDRERCLAAGMDGYLSKPLALKELQGILTKQ